MEKEEGEGGPSVRNIQTYNAPGPRRYIGINLWGLRGGRPARLYIRSDRVEYLALLCPVHISALPPLCLYHPPFTPPFARRRRAALLLSAIAFRAFLSRHEVAPCAIRVPSSAPPNKNHYFPGLTNAYLETRAPSSSLRTMRDFGKERRIGERIFHGRLRNFTDE